MERVPGTRPWESERIASSCQKQLRVLVLVVAFALPLVIPPAGAQVGLSRDLTEEERAYLVEHGPIRYAFTRGLEPFTLIDEQGTVRGINRDFLRVMNATLGVDFIMVEVATYSEALQAVANGSADISAPFAYSPERAATFGFTEPYLHAGSSLWAKEGTELPDDMRGISVAVIRGSAIAQTIGTKWPNVTIVAVDSIDSALVAVREGEVDAAVAADAPASYTILHRGYHDIVRVGESFGVGPISFIVAKDNDLLLSIMNKGLAKISREQRTEIFVKWTGLDLNEPLPAEPVISLRDVALGAVLLVTLAIAILVPVWIVTLRRAVAARTREIRLLNQDLEQFVYVASHDLKEPLRMVASFVSLLQQKYAGKLDAQAEEYIHFAVDGAHRMQALIDGVLEFSRIGVRKPRLGPVDLAGVLDEVRSNLTVAFSEKQARLEVGELPRVLGDRQLILQLMQNLVANALKFHKPGENPVVRVDANRDGDTWIVSVSDNGIGIDDEHQGQLFTLFRRLHTREEFPGNGIGLAVSRRIVEHHGGRIWVDSKVGEGATFRFTLGGTPA